MNKNQSVNETKDLASQPAEFESQLTGQPTYTRGPWKVRAATFCDDDGVPSYEVVMPGEPCMNAIDARLIGKAPELYEALEELTKFVDAFDFSDIYAEEEAGLIAAARAALDLSYKPDTNTLASSGTT